MFLLSLKMKEEGKIKVTKYEETLTVGGKFRATFTSNPKMLTLGYFKYFFYVDSLSNRNKNYWFRWEI